MQATSRFRFRYAEPVRNAGPDDGVTGQPLSRPAAIPWGAVLVQLRFSVTGHVQFDPHDSSQLRVDEIRRRIGDLLFVLTAGFMSGGQGGDVRTQPLSEIVASPQLSSCTTVRIRISRVSTKLPATAGSIGSVRASDEGCNCGEGGCCRCEPRSWSCFDRGSEERWRRSSRHIASAS